ncbi:MAG: hypothetical protein ACHQ4H_01140 [Ktedonobacterales bacterium]
MPENYEVVYSHPGGATATFVRHDGELDALAKALDAEQFWVFKNVKSLLVRNEPGDLGESNRLMAAIGFAAAVREIAAPRAAAAREPAYATAPTVVETAHAGPHLPGPSYWPLAVGFGVFVAFGGILFWTATLAITVIGMLIVFISMIGWGVEPV